MDAALRHFHAFLTVARLGSFTRASTALHVSQPALTVQIRQLEATLGLRLFDRTSRRVALTDAGRDLVAPVERLLGDFDALLRHAQDMTAHRRGTVTLAVLPSVAATLLPAAIRTLAERHPALVVRLRDVVAERVLTLVKAGEVDFGIGSLMRPDAEIETEPLMLDRLTAVVPSSHPLARRRRVGLGDLSSHPLVLTSRDSSVRQLVDRGFEQAGLRPRVVHEATYMTTAIALVRAGLGVAILPESASAGEADVLSILIHRPALTRHISLVTRAGRTPTPAAALFIELLRRQVRQGAPKRRATPPPPSS